MLPLFYYANGEFLGVLDVNHIGLILLARPLLKMLFSRLPSIFPG